MSQPLGNATKLAKYIYDNYANLAQPSERDVSNLAMLILEHDIETVADCADRAAAYCDDLNAINNELTLGNFLGLRSAILGDIAECKH